MYGGGYDAGGFGGGYDGGFDQFGGAGGGFMGGSDQFGGQAFMGSQGGGGGFNVDNSGPDGKAKSNKDKQSLLPVTIKQLKNAPSAASGEQTFTVDGQELHQVTVIGLILSADEQNTNLQYTLDDGTDDILVKMWVDQDNEDETVERRAQWREGKLVRVVGQLRIFNHSRSIVAFNIQPITDYNEYTLHFIEVIHSHLRLTKGKPAAPVGGTGYAAPVGGTAAAAAPPIPVSSFQDQVLAYFKSYDAHSETGCTVAQCFEAMQAQGATYQQIRDSVDTLVAEGHLYSTIDDDHFKGI
mmetsp:Transcript_29590/g.80818  ORF Transcript_29590/g.80818 Transcript_29590/m.80818 type:complete len:297 (+) Transcript_29590:94-984(+)